MKHENDHLGCMEFSPLLLLDSLLMPNEDVTTRGAHTYKHVAVY